MNFLRSLFSSEAEDRKQVRYDELNAKFESGEEEMTEAEHDESVQLFYELNPDKIYWDQKKAGTPKEIWGQNTNY